MEIILKQLMLEAQLTNENDFEFTETGTNNTIIIFGCDDSDCSDANGIITLVI